MFNKMKMGRYQRVSSDMVIIFTRYPIPGRTKTRLIPVLGAVGAADLQRKLTEKTLKAIKKFSTSRDIGVEVCFEGGTKRKMRRWLGSGPILSRQGTGDLGDRMLAAFIEAFQRGCRRVVLIGSDIPDLKTKHMIQAFDSLNGHDLVLGPSTDGGFWLIGMKRPINLFQGINWGTGAVLDQTKAMAKEKGLVADLLDPLTDMDTIDDLKKTKPEWVIERPYISVIIPALNEGANIEATIHGALDGEAEVIVVDGGSTDNTVERAIGSGARVETSRRGRALQQNRGAEIARGMLLLFLHADSRLPPGYVDHVFETLVDPKIVLGAFRFKTDLEYPLMKVVEFLANIRSRFLNLPYGDQGLFMRKSIFDMVDGFPEVPIAEDLFLVRRLSRLGNIKIAEAHIITSGRRWRTIGLLRTILINQVILAGCYIGVPPHALAPLYRVSGTPPGSLIQSEDPQRE